MLDNFTMERSKFLICAFILFSMQRPVDCREIFMKQSVGKCKQINF